MYYRHIGALTLLREPIECDMRSLIIRFFATVFALSLADYLLEGILLDGVYAAIIAAIILGVLNLVVRPILVVLTLPVTIITLGLFLFVLNAMLFWFVGSFVEGFQVAGFGSALAGSLVVSVVGWIADKLS